MGRDREEALAGWFWLKAFHEVSVKLLGVGKALESFWGWTGAEGSTPKVILMLLLRGFSFTPATGLGAWVLHTPVGGGRLLHRAAQNMAVSLPLSEWSKRQSNQDRSHCAFEWCTTLYNFSFTLLCSLEMSHQVQPTLKGRELELHLLKGGVTKEFVDVSVKAPHRQWLEAWKRDTFLVQEDLHLSLDCATYQSRVLAQII